VKKEKIKTDLLFLKYFLTGRNAFAAFEGALKNQFLPPEELEFMNWKRTQAIIKYAYEFVPYYAKVFKKIKLHPGDIITPNDLYKIPIVERKDIKNNFQEFISVKAKRRYMKLVSTGGTTGEPVKVYHDGRFISSVMWWRILSWFNLSPCVDVGTIWRKQYSNKLLWWPGRNVHLDVTVLSPDRMKRFIEEANRIRPKVIIGYTGPLDYLASFIKNNSIKVFFPEIIISSSSPITKAQELNIQSAFNAPVYDMYGCCEIYWLASQCAAKKSMHILYDRCRIEFLSESNKECKEGEEGELVITDFTNYVFPLIRYKNGDRGRKTDGLCGCGITLPLMEQVKGRTSDIVHLPSGNKISGEFLMSIFDDYPGSIRKYQVCQKKDYSILITVVRNKENPEFDKALNTVKARLLKLLNSEVKLEISEADDIVSRNCKHSYVISEINK